MSFDGKVAIVTGSSRGIGKEIALDLAKAGCKVVVTGTGGARDTYDKITQAGGTGHSVAVDVISGDSVSDLVKETTELFGGVDILVCNAGITKDTLLMRMKEDDWDQVLGVNLKGAFLCCKAAVRPLMKSKSGRIILITSVVGIMGNPGQSNYAASKAGLIGLTKSLAKEFSSRQVTVNAVAPGFIETDMTSEIPEKAREQVLETIPLGKFGQTQDIASAVRFLASEESSYITGHVLQVDGGLAM